MKNIRIKNLFKILMLSGILVSCEAELDLPPVDEFAPDNLVQSREGLEALLFSAYNGAHINSGDDKNEILINEVTTDVAYVRIGAVEREMKPFLNFNWDASQPHFEVSFWAPSYRAIRDANTLLENIDAADVEQEFKDLVTAEARYLRASRYAYLHRYFGVVPLRTTSNLEEQPQELPLPTEEEFLSFVETELREAAEDLLHPSEQTQRGRADKGHAYAVLTKFLLNTKQWSKVMEVTDQLMGLGYYQLFPDYRGLFFVENEGNKEVIISNLYTNEAGFHNTFPVGAFPPGFESTASIPEFTWLPSMANWATQFSLRDGFTDSFAPEDDRAEAVVQEYQNRGGNLVNLRTTPDNSRSIKYWDNSQIAAFCGADIPFIRYSDILLSRAEAINELQGPTPEALDLVNQVRTRSIDDAYTLEEAGDTDTFRDIILEERGWEFYSEGKRREDLIRHGKFIEYAQERGLDAQPHHVYFPYPQAEINANPALVQRTGY